MSVHIRRADPGRDGDGCAAIYAHYVLETAISFEESPPDGARMSDLMQAVQRRHAWLVAEVDEQPNGPAGFAYASPHRERSAYRWAVDVTIYTDRQLQRQGIGSALYRALLPDVAGLGYRTACAGITLPNPASIALHESFGFEHVSTFRRIGYKQGAWRDVGWWQLQLGTGEQPEPPAEPGR